MAVTHCLPSLFGVSLKACAERPAVLPAKGPNLHDSYEVIARRTATPAAGVMVPGRASRGRAILRVLATIPAWRPCI